MIKTSTKKTKKQHITTHNNTLKRHKPYTTNNTTDPRPQPPVCAGNALLYSILYYIIPYYSV